MLWYSILFSFHALEGKGFFTNKIITYTHNFTEKINFAQPPTPPTFMLVLTLAQAKF